MKKYTFLFWMLLGTCWFHVSTVAFLSAEEKSFPPQAILTAAYKGDVEMVREILATNPDMEVRDSLGATALHDAMFQKNMEVIQLLLDYGFDVNAVSPVNGFTPLHHAVRVNNVDAAKMLLAFNADKTIKDAKGLTPLEKAKKEGKREMVLLLERTSPVVLP